MRKIIYPILIAACFSCNQNTKINTADSKNETQTELASDTTTDLSFEGFRSALIENDLVKLKSYIKFPLQTDTYVSWQYAENRDNGEDGGDISLTQEDYNINMETFFPEVLGNILKKLSLDDLIKKKNITLPYIDEDGEEYEVDCIYDKELKEICLQYKEKNPIPIRDENDQSGTEYNEKELEAYRNKAFDDIRYFFEINGNKQIRLTKIDAYK